MVRILLPGRPCPEWLQRIDFDGGTSPTHRVAALSVVTITREAGRRHYRWRRVLPGPFVLLDVDPAGGSACIYGQSPDRDGAEVILDPQPVIGWPLLSMLAGFCLGQLMQQVCPMPTPLRLKGPRVHAGGVDGFARACHVSGAFSSSKG